MALTAYSFEARNTDGTLATGLTPSVAAIKKESDNSNITATIVFTETVPGLYKFYYDPLVDGEAFLQIDLGASITPASRYINLQLTADNNPLIDTNLTQKQALKAFAAILFGASQSSGGIITFKAQDGTTTVITASGFDGNGTRSITKGSL